jgi:hypothetical protein
MALGCWKRGRHTGRWRRVHLSLRETGLAYTNQRAGARTPQRKGERKGERRGQRQGERQDERQGERQGERESERESERRSERESPRLLFSSIEQVRMRIESILAVTIMLTMAKSALTTRILTTAGPRAQRGNELERLRAVLRAPPALAVGGAAQGRANPDPDPSPKP